MEIQIKYPGTNTNTLSARVFLIDCSGYFFWDSTLHPHHHPHLKILYLH